MTSPIRVYAPIELKAAFKHKCTLLGVSMSDRAIALIEADIADRTSMSMKQCDGARSGTSRTESGSSLPPASPKSNTSPNRSG